MAHINVYVDNNTLKKIEHAAHIEHVSLSKWIRMKLDRTCTKGWPKGYFDVFGCLNTTDIRRPETLNYALDIQRNEI